MARLYDRRLAEALHYVAELFAHKRRKSNDGPPYLSHLLAVTALVLENGGTEDEAIAAVLHDVLEDIEGTSESELAQRFGSEPARLVAALSDTLSPGAKEPWRTRKERHLERLARADGSVQRIAVADKVHNAAALLDAVAHLGDAAYLPFNGGKAGTLWYYGAAQQVLCGAPAPRLVARLSAVVAALNAAAMRGDAR